MDKTFAQNRFSALLDSKVINALIIAAICGVFLYMGSGNFYLPLVGAAIAFSLAIGYALWFLFTRPESIIVNNQLSQFRNSYTLYFLIVNAAHFESPLWYMFPIICAVIQMFVTLMRDGDEVRTFPAKQAKSL